MAQLFFRSLNKTIHIKQQTRCFVNAKKQYDKYYYKGPSDKPSMLLQNSRIDSSTWDDFSISPDDIFINTPVKAGTTWMQEIVAQLVYNGDYQSRTAKRSGWELSPWFACCLIPKEAMLKEVNDQLSDLNFVRRIIKTHEPVESMPFNPDCKYIFVGRDYRDIIWSMYNMYSLVTDKGYDLVNAQKDYPFQELKKFNFQDGSFTEYHLWNKMLNEPDDHGNPDGWTWWSQLWVIGSWMKLKHLQNVKIIHYNNLKDDLASSMRAIAQFLDIEIDENKFDKLVESCTFEKMKSNPDALGEHGDLFVDPSEFFYKGENNRWGNALTDEDNENYRMLARRYLTDDEIYWLETGFFAEDKFDNTFGRRDRRFR